MSVFNNEDWSNRSYVHYTDNYFEIPFLLNKQQAIDNPESIMGEGNSPMDELINISIRQPFRDSKQLRLANKTTYNDVNSTHMLGIYAEEVDDSFRNPLSQVDTTNRNIGLDYSFEYEHLSNDYRSTDSLLFVSANKGTMPRQFHAINPLKRSINATIFQY